MKYTVENGVQVIACTPAEFSIRLVDKVKRGCDFANYANGGFFWGYQGYTLPIGHLVADDVSGNKAMLETLGKMGKVEGGKVRYDNGKYSYGNKYCGKALSTFYVKGERCGIKEMVTLDEAYDFAVSGVPIMRNGNDVSWYNFCAAQGWLEDTVRASYHTFLGLRKGENPICLMGWKSTAKNMVYGMQAFKLFSKMGFTDVIKLDGGGSEIFKANGAVKMATAENRRINNVIVIDQSKTKKTATTTAESDIPFRYKTREAVLYIAKSQVGVTEAPANSNNVKYNTWYYGHAVSGSKYPWCMTFVQWVFAQAGFNLYKTASCGALATQYKNAGKWVTSGFKAGDIVMFDFSGGKTKTEHVGIIESIDKDGNLITIEGNTGVGDDVNGGAVMRRSRALKYVTGACRPDYNL